MSDRSGFGAFIVGFLMGILSGAVVALLVAPQSGAETRTLIKDKSIELRDKAQHTAEQARARADEFTHQLKEKGQSAVKAVRKNGVSQPEVETVA